MPGAGFLHERVDKALFRAQLSGKNRVEREPVAQPVSPMFVDFPWRHRTRGFEVDPLNIATGPSLWSGKR